MIRFSGVYDLLKGRDMDKLLSIDSPVMKGLTFVVNLVLLNILFILTSLPIITVGASLCALQTSIQNILHKKRQFDNQKLFTNL
ncbi:DUF624 domain-containing protein [Lactococcus fujiensis]|uniref:DUF624 domain-containing protein n=1 Tax=Lactococcus fujiensis TaxID=610251 RepID=UPI000AFFBD52